MNEFFKSLTETFSGAPVSVLTLLIMMISLLTVFPTFFKILLKEKGKRISSTEKLFKLINSNLEKGLIKDKEDILLLLNSVSREYYKDFSLSPIIEDYIAFLSEKDEKELLQKNYILLKDIINKENEEKPFSDVPNEERRLLKSIDDSVKHNDLESITFSLHELNSVISTRSKIYKRANAINRWSIPVALIGILLTIFFGIMSLRPAIDYDKIKAINTEIKNDTISKKP